MADNDQHHRHDHRDPHDLRPARDAASDPSPTPAAPAGVAGGTARPDAARKPSLMISHTSRTIRTEPAPFRWECPCQQPPVLLATYDPGGKINIKVRDRYWHLAGFGSVQAICPRCAAEHVLDLRQVRRRIDRPEWEHDHEWEEVEF